MKRTFTVQACWDEDAEIWYAKSDIIGLHIETQSLEEFEELLTKLAPDLIIANHLLPEDLTKCSIAELIPSILWQKPSGSAINA